MCWERSSPMCHEGSPDPWKCLFVSRECSGMTRQRGGMSHGRSPASGTGWGMSRPGLPVAHRGSAASGGRLDADALAGQLLEEPVQGGASGRAAERLEDRLAAEGFRQAGSAVPAPRIGSQAPAAGNVRIRFVS